MKKLRIAQVAPLWYPIPPKKYGGTERIVFLLSQELKKINQDITLFASPDSKTSVKLISPLPNSLVKMKVPWTENILNMEGLLLALKSSHKFDIIHSHLDHLTLLLQGLSKTSIVLTFHNEMNEKKNSSKYILYEKYAKKSFGVFISKNQRKNCPFKFKKSWVIYNGIDTSKFRFNLNPKDYFVWVGRFNSYKGPENAIKAARISGVKLLLVGKIDSNQKDYFKKNIQPYLSKKIRYLGELNQKELSSIYQNAKACLYPIEWEEPFGLIMAEAMACGTPVIAFNKGSVPELIENNKTGFVVPFLNKKNQKNIKGIVEGIKKIDTIKREDCRQRVENFFSSEKMAKNYEEAYREILKIKDY